MRATEIAVEILILSLSKDEDFGPYAITAQWEVEAASMAGLKSVRCGFAALSCLLLCACATGGELHLASADGLDGPAAPRRAPIPRLYSGEYRRSWGLEVINAFPAYQAGVTGRGVTIALIDVGVADAQPEVMANLSDRSTDLLTGRDPAFRRSRHADYVAGPLASALNGGGVVGVAYEATVLSVRAELDGRCRIDECRLTSADIARGLDYALGQGARVIALAVEGPRRMGPSFEAALERAKAAGAVVVVAAGNEAADQPSWPALYAADPRFSDVVVAVGAVNARSRLARWSNRAGAAQASYLLAPGQNVITDCDNRYCALVSGTSFAVPYVAGALALVMQAEPQLDAQAAAGLLKRGARDLGRRGPDAVYGCGLVDVGRALKLARVS